MRNVAILVFNEVEVLDFSGPYEVFNVTAELTEPTPFSVYTCAESAAPVKTRGNLVIHPNYSITSMPQADILLIPGGQGSRALLKKPHILTWLRDQSTQVEYLLSVCTGSLVLAAAGLLNGKAAATHHSAFEHLQQLAPSCTVVRDQRYVVSDRVISSGGIAAGIDMALYTVRSLLGDSAVATTLGEMEYAWSPQTDLRWPEAVIALEA